jgi:hypothetical protein
MATVTHLTGSRGGSTAICGRVRAELVAAGPRPAPADAAPSARRELAAHLATCPDCAAFSRRLDLAREALARPLSPPWAALPDGSFAARVAARIERPAELLGWAAFRALPAALGLAMALAILGMSWSSPAPPPTAVASAPPQLLLDEPSADQLVAFASAPAEATP